MGSVKSVIRLQLPFLNSLSSFLKLVCSRNKVNLKHVNQDRSAFSACRILNNAIYDGHAGCCCLPFVPIEFINIACILMVKLIDELILLEFCYPPHPLVSFGVLI